MSTPKTNPETRQFQPIEDTTAAVPPLGWAERPIRPTLTRLQNQGERTMDVDPLTAYMSHLQFCEPLPHDEQRELAIRFKEHDDADAAKLLMLTNLRLVVKIATEYRRRDNDALELIQAGNVGLAEAIDRFDPHRGVHLSSYAQFWIRAMIFNHLIGQAHPVNVGSTRAGRKLFFRLKKTRYELIQRGIDPTPANVADYLDVAVDDVRAIGAQLDMEPLSLDMPPSADAPSPLGEMLESDTAGPERQTAAAEALAIGLEALRDFVDSLDNERERSIFVDRMIADEPKTLRELGAHWDVSKERIRQIELRLRDRLEQHIRTEVDPADLQAFFDWREAV